VNVLQVIIHLFLIISPAVHVQSKLRFWWLGHASDIEKGESEI
jgi:hypothetical protein